MTQSAKAASLGHYSSSSECEVLAVGNTSQTPSPKKKEKKTMAPLSYENPLKTERFTTLASRNTQQRNNPNRGRATATYHTKKIFFYVGTVVYFAVSNFCPTDICDDGSSRCGKERTNTASLPFVVAFYGISIIPYALILPLLTSNHSEPSFFRRSCCSCARDLNDQQFGRVEH